MLDRLAAAVFLLLVGGCQTLGYYAQAVHGQVDIWRKTRPVEAVIADPDTDAALRERLRRVEAIRNFASSELALPDNGSYRSYADLGRPYVVWNVFATPELSLQPRQWCFLFAGCVAYRGYFSRDDARAFALTLQKQGDDVVAAGVPAYSTLGWFDDPVLNTFVNYSDIDLARLIFHELAHQVAYADDDTEFNESFAVSVELEGVNRWLESHGTAEQRDAWSKSRIRKAQFDALIDRTRERLSAIYDSDRPDQQKREQKARIFDEMRRDYWDLKQDWGGYSGYDFWLEEPLNNAKLVPLTTYTALVPGFQRLLSDEGGDLRRFYTAVKALTKRSPEERRLALH